MSTSFNSHYHVITASTKNSIFQEVFSFLTYESSSTQMKSLQIVPTSKGFNFYGIRIISYPNLTMMARKFVENFPDEIEIKVKGYIDETGHARITTILPESYKKYASGVEIIDFYPKKEDNIKVSLKYNIVQADEEGIMGAFRNGVYNGMVEKLESYFIDLYKEKRKNCFNGDVKEIKNLDELRISLNDNIK